MISEGRFGYHLADIAEAEKDSTSPQNIRLKLMRAEVKEFEEAFPADAKRIRERFEKEGY